MLIFFLNTSALNYYWIGGTGNWSSLSHWATTPGGTTLHSEIPTANDDVFFDANSFSSAGQTVTLDPLTILVHDIKFINIAYAPILTGASSNLLKIYGSLIFTTGMTMNFAGPVNFEATTAGNTIAMAGKSFQEKVIFNGIDGEWTLQDAFTTSTIIRLIHGHLFTNNKTVNAESFHSETDLLTIRALSMGSSVFNISGGNLCWWIDGAGLTLDCGTSSINCSNPGADFRGGSHTYYNLNFTNTFPTAQCYLLDNNNFHDVVFTSNGNIFQSNTFHNVIFYSDGLIDGDNVYNDLTFTAGHSYQLWSYSASIGSTQTINGTFHANGNCGALINIHSEVQGANATIKHNAGTVNISFAVLKDIAATGGSNFIAGNSIDLGNNIGWTFTGTSSQNLYWINNGGNWNDGNHWSFTSGGSPSGCSPTPFSNVFFDANSFSSSGQTVTINPLTAYCNDMNWTGVTNHPILAGPQANVLKIFGSLKFIEGMDLSFSGPVNFEAITPGKTITLAGKYFFEKINFNGIEGEWVLQDDFKTTTPDGRLTLSAGTLNSNNKTVTAVEFYTATSAAKKMIMGSSLFNITGGGACWITSNINFILECGTSVINCLGIDADFHGGNLTYHNLNFTDANSSGTIGNTNKFNDVIFYGKGNIYNDDTFRNVIFHADGLIEGDNVYNDLTFSKGHSYSLWSYSNTIGSIQTVNGTFHADGSCGALINIHSSTDGAQAKITSPVNPVNTSYLILKDIGAAGTTNFITAHSVDLGNNSNWTFNGAASQNLYWINNTGNWDDGNHWSYTSGGSPAGCSPTPADNVFFDGNSFSLAGQTVSTGLFAYCKDMTWIGVAQTPTLFGASTSSFNIYGSLTFAANMNLNFAGVVNFEAVNNGNKITMAGKSFPEKINFNGVGGEWTLQDDFTTFKRITFNAGTLNSNNKTVNAFEFYSYDPMDHTLNMGSSVFNISGSYSCWNVLHNGFNLNCGTSVINFTSAGADFRGGIHTYYDLNFTASSSEAFVGDSNHFHNLSFASAVYIPQSNIIHKAIFYGNAKLGGSNTFDELIFTADHTYTLYSFIPTYTTTQTINNRWQIQGSCTSYIILQSSNPGIAANVIKPSGAVLGYNIHIKDINCSGGADFIAYNSVDLGGNSGWNFSSLPPLLNPDIIMGPSQVCSGATGVLYFVPAVQGAISYQWTVPSGAVITSGQGDSIITVDFGTALSGNITVESFNGCNAGTSGSTFAVVLANQLTPTVKLNAIPAGFICPGTPVTFAAHAANTGNSNINYDFKINGISVQHGNSNVFTSTTLSDADQVTCSISISAASCYVATTAISNMILMDVGSASANNIVHVNTCSNQLPYNWNNQSYSSAGNYSVILTNSSGCDSIVQLNLVVLSPGANGCNCSPKIPNAFTPNGDGINDLWIISPGNCSSQVGVSVYNRYGSQIYHSDNYKNDWKGTYKSKPCPDGTYYYVIKLIYPVAMSNY